jgi:DNA topoisomerase VI subunit B
MSAPASVIARTTFSTSRLLEFASVRELVAQTGTSPDDWPLMLVRELIDNALDAAEEAGISPRLRVIVSDHRIRVTDNGPGIPPETVASILDFSTRTSSREAYVAPDRGRQGNALKTVIAIPFALGSGESRIEIVARGIRHDIRFKVDRIAQAPAVCAKNWPRVVEVVTKQWVGAYERALAHYEAALEREGATLQ